MTGTYRPEAIPIHDTAPSEVELPESTLLPCGCDALAGQECAICCPHPSRAGTIAAIDALEVEDLPVQEYLRPGLIPPAEEPKEIRLSVQDHSPFMNREQACWCIPKDTNSVSSGGDHKDAGKSRLDLLDAYAIEQMGHVLGFGASKYSPFNWTKGIAYTRLQGSALRHILAFQRGEDLDPESGLPHLAHGMCCLMMLLGMTQRHPELDDRCKTEAA